MDVVGQGSAPGRCRHLHRVYKHSSNGLQPCCAAAEEVPAGLEQGVQKMKVGETALLTVSPRYAFGGTGHKGAKGFVPPNTAVQYVVELLELHKVGPLPQSATRTHGPPPQLYSMWTELLEPLKLGSLV